jgi:hypothetical protein
MITIVHGGQTGVDRGAHEAAIASGWLVAGYMPRDGRDELGPIPPDVARFLIPHASRDYAARTEANVQSASAVLIVVRDAREARSTPGTAKTIDLAERRKLRPVIVDPSQDIAPIARWICGLIIPPTLMLPLDGVQIQPDPIRLMIAGPRESKWSGAQAAAADLLRRLAFAITEIGRSKERDQPRQRR